MFEDWPGSSSLGGKLWRREIKVSRVLKEIKGEEAYKVCMGCDVVLKEGVGRKRSV